MRLPLVCLCLGIPRLALGSDLGYTLLNPSSESAPNFDENLPNSIGWHKHDCGKDSRLSCLQNGCVWQPVAEQPEGPIPWCYYWTNRIDCHPDPDATQQSCEAKGCQWLETKIPSLPWCVYELPSHLIDCHPDKGATYERCTSRGCMWNKEIGVETPGKPYCAFAGGKKFAGYSLQTSVDVDSNAVSVNGKVEGTLTRLNTPTLFGNDLDNLHFSVTPITNDHVRIQINTNADNIKSHSPFIDQYLATTHDVSNPKFEVIVQQNPFGFAVVRRDGGIVVFDTRNIPGLTIENQYVQLTTTLPTDFIYGLGENAQLRLKRNVTWDKLAFFSRDIPPDPTANSHQNLYGVHPFYMGVERSSKAHGVFWNNMHGLNVALQSPSALTYRAIGGMIDVHVILGDNPNEVVRNYVAMIGKPMLPPYWGLGFQLCRYGYKDLQEVKDTVARVQATGVPLETQYADIDYMDAYKDFTVGEKFAGLGEFTKELKDQGMHLVLITDPAIASRATNYSPLTKGLEYDVFIKNSTGQNLEGKVWPGQTFYPDFTHPNATAYWFGCLKDFHDNVPFDGMWYDMNEVSNFVQGSLHDCPNTPTNNPPFNPVADEPIYTKALCLDAVHYGGKKEYELHNLYGYSETRIANEAHRQLFPGLRPFMVSRSTAPSSGVDTAHWSGDVFSRWSTMRYSIINMVQFSLFGISWTGSDICGFLDDTTELLCVRWQQLGAFYPFSRNHNSLGNKPQDPGVWSKPAQEAIAKAVLVRYKYLPYLYTQMVKAHLDGTPVVRGMFFDFPNDPVTFDLDDQFLQGDSILVSPVTNPDNSATVYFPAGRWYGLEFSNDELKLDSGTTKAYQYDLDKFGLFARGGSVIPWQEPATTTAKSRQNPFGILVNFNENYAANGELYWDDGVSYNSYQNGGQHAHFKFTAFCSCNSTTGFLVIVKDEDTFTQPQSLKLNTVQIRGVAEKPASFKVSEASVDPAKVKIDPTNGWIEITDLDVEFGTVDTVKVTWR